MFIADEHKEQLCSRRLSSQAVWANLRIRILPIVVGTTPEVMGGMYKKYFVEALGRVVQGYISQVEKM